ncbi:transcriptional regulator, IclR family [Rhodococcus rhodochrous J3]|uniref:IclR family transcriptional regulator n=2 Tax=Rhodococcus rhodochrous TaxID=1829 RepID=A0AA47A9Z7_RHORH|nr:IclR family transcriptional regulator [Rhodococcus rhodochrous]MCR8693268.1 IclR family transcriptional regulator [Rhodococcus pyridinivorans]AYA24445.1 IclR family transcriptional regulator [Rhodococcus rhodochrous]MBF4480419.1 IclR family transcriptional regulator [Rhodococcus rhodochrous]MCB8911579.1 IclR family transcriptional regulator [Rhodococcus rhodochrous]MCD2099695.1 IclR family transcriptional regulator [Rhodococcus rhodochrous]
MANSPSGDSMLDRVVRILESFDDTQPRLTVGSLARRSGIPQATTYRLVGELVQHGLLTRDDDGRVRLGLRLWELVARSAPARDLREAALPFLQDVQSVVHQHTQLAVLQDDEVLVLERLSASDSVVNQASVARRLPVHDTSLGMSMLAFSPAEVQEAYRRRHPEVEKRFAATTRDFRRALAEVRRRGYARFDGVLDEGTTGIAVPVLARSGHALAALGVVVPTGASRQQAVVPVLMAAARGIARGVGERPPD